MANLNGEKVLVIESDKDNNITYVELINGVKKWVNSSELENDAEDKSEVVIKKTKKEK